MPDEENHADPQPTDAAEPILTRPIAGLTVGDLLRLGILGRDPDKKPPNSPLPQYALMLSRAQLANLANILARKLQAASPMAAAKKAPAKKTGAKKAPAKKATAKGGAAK